MLKHTAKLLRFAASLIEKSYFPTQEKPSPYVDDIATRDILIREVYRKIESGQSWLEAIRTPKASNHGERVAEYAFIASLLKDLEPSSILDVGCVLNNPVIAAIVERQSHIYFLNPALETVHYQEYGYFKYSLSSWRVPMTFPLVTCLSTLEHIGFDNTRYGVNEFDQGWDWPRCVEEVVRSIEILYSMTEPGGMMVVSCPYGCAEYVLLPPETGVRSAQVLHMKHIEALRKTFGFHLEIITLRLSLNGWEPHAPDDNYQPYGEVGPGASGLILIFGKKT